MSEGWRERLRIEHSDIKGKIERLEAWRSTDEYRRLERAERDRATAQLMFMRGYCAMLAARIESFGSAK